jgi:hypothetical protein
MDRSRWIRNPAKVQAALAEQPDRSELALRDVRIYIPARFAEKQLAEIGAEIYTVGIFAMVVDDKYYAVSTVNAMMRLKPTTISTVKFDGDSYLEFRFPPGSTVIADTNLIRTDSLVFKIFSELISKGRVPWYLDYEDMAKLFETAESHANVRFGAVHSIMEMFVAAIARDPADRAQYYRSVYEERDGKPTVDPSYIPFVSITYGATNTTSRLLGSYFDQGLVSALTNPSEKTEHIEQLLRR